MSEPRPGKEVSIVPLSDNIKLCFRRFTEKPMSYFTLKTCMYVAQFLLGMFLCGYAYYSDGNSITDVLARAILMVVGLGCILFSAATYCLLDDPDVWR